MKYVIAVGVLFVVLVFGCTDPPSIEIHEPGEYKGQTDPLVQKSEHSEHQEALRERLRMVQTDR